MRPYSIGSRAVQGCWPLSPHDANQQTTTGLPAPRHGLKSVRRPGESLYLLKRVVTICANATLGEAAQLMCERGVDTIFVVAAQGERPTALGIITDSDIARARSERPDHVSRLRVWDVLSKLLVFDQGHAVESAIRALRPLGLSPGLLECPGEFV